jgi:hypothetical protein
MTSRSSKVYWRWVLVCTLGEIIGFGGVPILAGSLVLVLTASLDPIARSLLLFAASVIGGLGEGAILAAFQLRVLHHLLPSLNTRRWLSYTAVAASFAWFCGMLTPLLDDILGLAATVRIALWIPASILILLSIGTAQSWVLQGVVDKPYRWIVANVLGWLLGLPWTFVLPSLLPDDAPVAAWVATFGLAGVMMGLTVGLVTGRLLVRLVPRDPKPYRIAA